MTIPRQEAANILAASTGMTRPRIGDTLVFKEKGWVFDTFEQEQGVNWVLLHDLTLDSEQFFMFDVDPYQEYEVHIRLLRQATAFSYIEVNEAAPNDYFGGTFRVAGTTLSGRSWTGSGPYLDSTVGTATVNALVRIRANQAANRISIDGVSSHESGNVGLILGGNVIGSVVSSIEVNNGALEAPAGSRVAIFGRGPIT